MAHIPINIIEGLLIPFEFKIEAEPSKIEYSQSLESYWQSVADSVIQATWTMEFEDGLWIGNHLKAQNGLQRVVNIPWVQPGSVRTPGFLQGQTEFQSAWVHMAV